MDLNQSFGKAYKLCSKKQIDELFEHGRSVKSYPLIAKFKYQEYSDSTPFQIVISAPKRNFKNATQRNKIKRLCKEAIRKHKAGLENFLADENKQLGIFLIYSVKEELTATQIESKIVKLFDKIIKELHESQNN